MKAFSIIGDENPIISKSDFHVANQTLGYWLTVLHLAVLGKCSYELEITLYCYSSRNCRTVANPVGGGWGGVTGGGGAG